MTQARPILGLVEEAMVYGSRGRIKRVKARIDTGAQNSAIDLTLAQELQLGPIMNTKKIRSSHGNSLRPVVMASITIGGRKMKAEFTLYNRSHMKYKVLVGQNILKDTPFLIDPSK